MSRKWKVEVPVSICESYVVEADSAKEALDKAEHYAFCGGYEGGPQESFREIEDIAYWEAKPVSDCGQQAG